MCILYILPITNLARIFYDKYLCNAAYNLNKFESFSYHGKKFVLHFTKKRKCPTYNWKISTIYRIKIEFTIIYGVFLSHFHRKLCM